MKTYKAKLKGLSPYSSSKYVDAPKLQKELFDAYEKRTWRSKLHVDEHGVVFIPPMAFKNCLSEAAKFLSVQIPGKGKSTYTKHFEAGVLVYEPVSLGIKQEDVQGEWRHVPADGKRGGPRRVLKCFPIIHEWNCVVNITVLDETIAKDVLLNHLEEAGKFIGVGRFRPRNNGIYGRFSVESLTEG